MSLVHKSKLSIKLGDYAIGSTTSLIDPLLVAKAQDYRRFIGSLMDRVARRHEEHGTAISAKEQAAIDEITAALGAGGDASV